MNEQQTTRGQVWRLLDTAGGVALGILLCLGVQAGAAGATPHAAPTATPTPNVVSWEAGPYPGCVLIGLGHLPVNDEYGAVTYQIDAVWSCPHYSPPPLITPTPGAHP